MAIEVQRAFERVGNGWCRPNCNVRSSSCRTNAFLKVPSNHDECGRYCLEEPSCSGFAISEPWYSYPNRCFVYGDISSSVISSSNGWKPYPKQVYGVFKSSGHKGVECFNRSGNTDIELNLHK